MSVLSTKRTQSKAEFVNKANEIYVQTIRFLTRLSSRYSRLIAEPIAKLASEVIIECEKANSIYPSSTEKKRLRLDHLTEARASLRALDVQLSHAYQIMIWNPQGCFSDTVPKHDGTTATIRLDRMADQLGALIDDEESLIRGVIFSDTQRQARLLGVFLFIGCRSANYNNNNNFCNVNNNGNANNNNANNSGGLAPGFCESDGLVEESNF